MPGVSEVFVFKFVSYRNIPRHILKIKFIALLPLKYVCTSSPFFPVCNCSLSFLPSAIVVHNFLILYISWYWSVSRFRNISEAFFCWKIILTFWPHRHYKTKGAATYFLSIMLSIHYWFFLRPFCNEELHENDLLDKQPKDRKTDHNVDLTTSNH
jgi:hypothetical protein